MNLKPIPELDKREVQLCMSSGLQHESEDETKTRTRLNLGEVCLGESLFVPFELIHEPSLRVKVARANGIPLGQRFRIIKHGPPASAYEIACVSGPAREPVGNDEPEDVSRETPSFVPPVEDAE